MLLTKRSATKRSGATIVEFAAVCTIFCMILFGILEYTLFLYTYDVMQNAAREGTRFAVVNSEDANLVADTQAYVKTLMMGLDQTNTGYSCNVYLSDVNGNNINSTNPPVANATTAAFGQPICVQISLTYKPLTPALFFPANSFNMQALCYMSSEGN